MYVHRITSDTYTHTYARKSKTEFAIARCFGWHLPEHARVQFVRVEPLYTYPWLKPLPTRYGTTC